MQNYDFDLFLNSIRHFSYEDKVETAKRRQIELQKVKSGTNRKEALLLSEKIKAFLQRLEESFPVSYKQQNYSK